MHLLVLPVSGGGFVSQLAIIQHLCESQYIPDLTLASSGGNVCAYVAAAADWKWAKTQRIAEELTQQLFMEPWTSVSIFSFIIGYFEGNVYNKGSGVYDFLSRHFSSKTIGKYEIWTGTYNKLLQKSRLFCNRSCERSIVDATQIDEELTQCMPAIFTNGDIDKIAKAGVASASIPAVVPAQEIDNELYVDGGVGGASPLAIMREPLLTYVAKHQCPLHITYINSIDLSSTNINSCKNVFDNWTQVTNDLVRSQTAIDRRSGYDLLRQLQSTSTIESASFPCTYHNIERVKQIRTNTKYTMIELYPICNITVDIGSFNGANVVAAMNEIYPQCYCRLWWIPDRNGDRHIIDALLAGLTY